MKSYSITIRPPEKDIVPAMYSAHANDPDITVEGQTPEEALSYLFDMIRLVHDLNESEKKHNKTAKPITFQIPVFA